MLPHTSPPAAPFGPWRTPRLPPHRRMQHPLAVAPLLLLGCCCWFAAAAVRPADHRLNHRRLQVQEQHQSSPTPAGACAVELFGAKGDGTTDDTAALQRAIDCGRNASRSGVTRVVVFPSGTFRVTARPPNPPFFTCALLWTAGVLSKAARLVRWPSLGVTGHTSHTFVAASPCACTAGPHWHVCVRVVAMELNE